MTSPLDHSLSLALDSPLVKVLITGAAGLVGAHLTQSLGRAHDVLALNHSDLDITDRKPWSIA